MRSVGWCSMLWSILYLEGSLSRSLYFIGVALLGRFVSVYSPFGGLCKIQQQAEHYWGAASCNLRLASYLGNFL